MKELQGSASTEIELPVDECFALLASIDITSSKSVPNGLWGTWSSTRASDGKPLRLRLSTSTARITSNQPG